MIGGARPPYTLPIRPPKSPLPLGETFAKPSPTVNIGFQTAIRSSPASGVPLARVPFALRRGGSAEVLQWSRSAGPLHNHCHSCAGGNPGGGANGNLTAKQSLESADIELCKEPSAGEGWGEGERAA